jgi:hypothetical protein
MRDSNLPYHLSSIFKAVVNIVQTEVEPSSADGVGLVARKTRNLASGDWLRTVQRLCFFWGYCRQFRSEFR